MVGISDAGVRQGSHWAAAIVFAFAFSFPVIGSAATPAPAEPLAGEADPWTISLSSQIEYYSWTSTKGYPATGAGAEGSGSQTYMPVGVKLAGRPSELLSLEFLVRSAFFYSSQETAGMSGTARGMTDTSLTATGTYYGMAGLQPFLSLTTNLPTGNAEQSAASSFGKMDSDVVDTPVFGEGFNGGVTLGTNIPLTPTLIASVGAGYTYRGAYDRESFAGPGTTKIDPGDTYSVNLGLGFQGERLSWQTQIAYTGESETELNDAPYYQSGGSVFTSLGLGYAWSDEWASDASISYTHTEKNHVLTSGLPPLVAETLNSNSDVVKLDFATNYAGEDFSLGPKIGFVRRNANSWSPTDLEYLPAKTSWSLGLAGQYAVTPDFILSADVARIWLKENQSPDKTLLGPGSGIPEITTRAWQMTIGGSWQF